MNKLYIYIFASIKSCLIGVKLTH